MLLLAACSTEKAAPPSSEFSLRTSRGNLTLPLYKTTQPARANILLASGDGGWTKLESKMAWALASSGFRVAGWDCSKYAKLGQYDRTQLSRDMGEAVRQMQKECGSERQPVILAGFSTGAEQVVAVASNGAARPKNLDGLLLLSPGHRGRYGINMSDLMGVTPQGPDTFALVEMAPDLKGLRVYQIHGEHDPLDQTEWLDSLDVPHQLAVYPDGWHLFRGAPPDFLAMVSKGARWILND